jgi:hypothetical protein
MHNCSELIFLFCHSHLNFVIVPSLERGLVVVVVLVGEEVSVRGGGGGSGDGGGFKTRNVRIKSGSRFTNL